MWQSLRAKHDLPHYQESDFLENGSVNLVLKVDGIIVHGLYAKQQAQDATTLDIHRWTLPFVEEQHRELFQEVEQQAKIRDFNQLRVLASSNEEMALLARLGYRQAGEHQNSTPEERLVWFTKTI